MTLSGEVHRQNGEGAGFLCTDAKSRGRDDRRENEEHDQHDGQAEKAGTTHREGSLSERKTFAVDLGLQNPHVQERGCYRVGHGWWTANIESVVRRRMTMFRNQLTIDKTFRTVPGLVWMTEHVDESQFRMIAATDFV